jgi:hypothetical protein
MGGGGKRGFVDGRAVFRFRCAVGVSVGEKGRSFRAGSFAFLLPIFGNTDQKNIEHSAMEGLPDFNNFDIGIKF